MIQNSMDVCMVETTAQLRIARDGSLERTQRSHATVTPQRELGPIATRIARACRAPGPSHARFPLQ